MTPTYGPDDLFTARERLRGERGMGFAVSGEDLDRMLATTESLAIELDPLTLLQAWERIGKVVRVRASRPGAAWPEREWWRPAGLADAEDPWRYGNVGVTPEEVRNGVVG